MIDTRKEGILMPDGTHMPPEAVSAILDACISASGKVQALAGAIEELSQKSSFPDDEEVESAADSYRKKRRLSQVVYTPLDMEGEAEAGFIEGVRWLMGTLNREEDIEDDMYCEGCCNFFSSSFQDNEAYCPKCGGTEIFESKEKL